MRRRDYERAYRLQKKIAEMKTVSKEGISIRRSELKRLEDEFDKIKRKFEIIADDLPCDIYTVLELKFFGGWSYYMIKKYLSWSQEQGTPTPKKLVEEYFAKIERKKRSI